MPIETFGNSEMNLSKLLSGMPEDIKERSIVQEFPAKVVLVKKDQKPTCVYLMYLGTLRIFNEFENGKILQTAKVNDMDFVGVLEVLSSKDKIAATVETVTKCVALKISNEDFLKWIDKDHNLAITVAKKLASNFYSTTYSNGKLLLNSTMYTLVSFIIDMVKVDIDEFKLGVVNKKRQEIADELGISLRTIQRNIKKLKDADLISIKIGKINVDSNQYNKLVDKLNELV